MSPNDDRRWSEALRVKEEIEPELLRRPEVTGVDVGYKEVGGKPTNIIAIRIFVSRKRDVSKDQTIPKEIRGIPTDVIERRFVLHAS